MKNLMNRVSAYFENVCKERQESLMHHWTEPVADREFYDIVNACFTHRGKDAATIENK